MPGRKPAGDPVVGSRVRAARIRRGMTQEALAEPLGVTLHQVHRMETGFAGISTVRLREIASVLGVPMSELVSDEKPAPLERDPRDLLVGIQERTELLLRRLETRGRGSGARMGSDGGSGRRVVGPELAFAGGFHGMAAGMGSEADIEVLGFEVEKPPTDIARLLGLAAEAKALLRVRRQGVGGTWYRTIRSWMPNDLFGDVAESRPQSRSLFSVLAERKGIHVVRADERLRVIAATADDAARLEVDVGTCLLEIERVCWTDSHKVAEVATIHTRPDLWEFWYRYPVGSVAYAEDWPWVRRTPTGGGSAPSVGGGGDPAHEGVRGLL